jgi:hypothetical protein
MHSKYTSKYFFLYRLKGSAVVMVTGLTGTIVQPVQRATGLSSRPDITCLVLDRSINCNRTGLNVIIPVSARPLSALQPQEMHA